METRKPLYVRIKDESGNDFVCPMDSLKDANRASEAELEDCVEDAVVGRYAGNIEIVG